jgi:hypothetical protein
MGCVGNVDISLLGKKMLFSIYAHGNATFGEIFSLSGRVSLSGCGHDGIKRRMCFKSSLFLPIALGKGRGWPWGGRYGAGISPSDPRFYPTEYQPCAVVCCSALLVSV